MKESTMDDKIKAGAVALLSIILIIPLLWLGWPVDEQHSFWMPENSVIKNPSSDGKYYPIIEFRSDSIVLIPFELYKKEFSNNQHEIYIQENRVTYYVTEKNGIKGLSPNSTLKPMEKRPHFC
ncbi:MAG: hypothetical protein PHF35_01410 [Candidatus Moranbacteria bacterium]|nr:hypothetical protein [Candidatus Moranbacteria bacterium]